jgi:hypothetical protein
MVSALQYVEVCTSETEPMEPTQSSLAVRKTTNDRDNSEDCLLAIGAEDAVSVLSLYQSIYFVLERRGESEAHRDRHKTFSLYHPALKTSKHSYWYVY